MGHDLEHALKQKRMLAYISHNTRTKKFLNLCLRIVNVNLFTHMFDAIVANLTINFIEKIYIDDCFGNISTLISFLKSMTRKLRIDALHVHFIRFKTYELLLDSIKENKNISIGTFKTFTTIEDAWMPRVFIMENMKRIFNIEKFDIKDFSLEEINERNHQISW